MRNFTFFATFFLAGLLTFNSNSQSILCVDRDGSFEAVDVYTDDWQFLQPAMDALGYPYTYFEVQDLTQNGPDLTTMNQYDIIFWFTGEAWTDSETMTNDDEFNLLLYLTLNNGKLLLSAQDYLYDRYSSAGTFDPGSFPYDALGCTEVVQDVWNIEPDTGNVVGVAGSLAEGMHITVFDIYTELNADDGLYIDDFVQHQGQDMLEVVFPEPTGIGAYQFEGANFRTIFTTVSLAAIVDPMDLEEILDRSFAWLLGTTGINANNINSSGDMLIYPNPVKDITRVGCSQVMNEIWVINTTGQVVQHFTVGDYKTTLNVSGLNTGIYLIRAQTADGMVTSRMIVD